MIPAIQFTKNIQLFTIKYSYVLILISAGLLAFFVNAGLDMLYCTHKRGQSCNLF